MKILHILNSDFGLQNTMGYRSYQIYKNSEYDLSIFSRSNKSEFKSKQIKTPFPFFREYSRLTQFISQRIKTRSICLLMKKIEVFLFDYYAKKNIQKSDVIHFFHHSPKLMEYANKLKKITIIESFSHSEYIQKMNNDGIKLDNLEFDNNSTICYKHSKYIISPSDWVTKTLYFAKLDSRKIREIPYGVNYQKDKEFNILDSRLKIIFAGGLKRTKGIIELLEAIICLEGMDIELHVFGREFSTTKSEISKLTKGKNNIKFHGFTTDIIDEYKKGDLYIYPTYFEGSSKTVFEAMSCGLPVITTPNAGSIVRDGVDGFIVPVNDVKSLVDKIRFFNQNRLELQIMGQNAQKYSREFSWELYGNKVNNLYQSVYEYES